MQDHPWGAGQSGDGPPSSRRISHAVIVPAGMAAAELSPRDGAAPQSAEVEVPLLLPGLDTRTRIA